MRNNYDNINPYGSLKELEEDYQEAINTLDITIKKHGRDTLDQNPTLLDDANNKIMIMNARSFLTAKALLSRIEDYYDISVKIRENFEYIAKNNFIYFISGTAFGVFLYALATR